MNKMYRKLGLLLFSLGAPVIYLVLSKTRRVRVAILVKDEVFVVKNWLGRGYWTLPGGGIRPGERPIDAAVRELKEEIGYKTDRSKLTDVVSGIANRSFFLLRLSTKPDIKLRKTEIVEADWIPLTNLEQQQLSNEAQQVLTALTNRPNLLK